MLLTTRFIASLPVGPEQDGIRDELSRYALKTGLEILLTDRHFIAIERSHPKSPRGEAPEIVVDLFAGTMAAFGEQLESGDETDWESIHEILERTGQIYNVIEVGPESLRIESDFLGLKPVYRVDIANSVVLASSIRDLAAMFPESVASGDPIGLCEFFTFGMPLYEKTLHAGIRRLQTGACLEWRDGSLSVSRRRRFLPSQAEADLSVSEATARIRETTLGVLTRRLETASRPVSLALSGGFDSRLIAALASDANVPLQTYSYGEAHHTEIKCARAVAQTLNLQQTILRYDADSVFRNLPLYLQHVEGQADPMMVQMTNLLNIPASAGATLLHGFLGDALSGAHLEWLISARPQTADEIARDVVSHRVARCAVGGTSIPEFTALPVKYEEVMHHIAANLPRDTEAHQSLILFDCENRQRRSVGSQMALLGSRFHVIIPNYAREVFEAYFRLPRTALDDRYILRRVFARYWPQLASIPHAEEEYPILPKLRSMLPFALSEYKHVFGKRLIGADRYDKMRRRWRDPYLWRMSYGVSNPQQALQLADQISSSTALLERRFGVRLRSGDAERLIPTAANPVEPHFGRRLFALSKYGNWLEAQVRMTEAVAV